MRSYPTGVTVVTARAPGGGVLGMTATSFTSVSLDPPLILVCVDHASSSHDGLVAAETFCVNILSTDQADLAMRFSFEPSTTRFASVAWREAPSRSPILEGAVAWIECGVAAVHPGGDHSILVGNVLDTEVMGGEALAFYRGTFRRFDR